MSGPSRVVVVLCFVELLCFGSNRESRDRTLFCELGSSVSFSCFFFVLGLTVRVEIELCFVNWVGSYLSPVFLRYEDFCAGFYGAGSLWLRTAVFVVGFFLRTKISLTDDPVF
jgi:hypothetical protein